MYMCICVSIWNKKKLKKTFHFKQWFVQLITPFTAYVTNQRLGPLLNPVYSPSLTDIRSCSRYCNSDKLDLG